MDAGRTAPGAAREIRMRSGTLQAALMVAALTAGGPTPAHQAAAPGYSFASLYNTANAYARAGQPGMAALNYERASLLAPDNPDVAANLLAVRRAAGLPAESRSRLDRTLGAADPTLISWLGVLGVALMALSASAGGLPASYSRIRVAGAVIGLALVGLTVASAALLWPRLHEAIVIVSAAPARVAPAPMGEALFVLKEAQAVRTAGEYEGFVLVRTPAGRTGWVWHTDLEAVVPQQ